MIWEKFAVKKGITPVFSKLNDGVVPLVFPAYVLNATERRGLAHTLLGLVHHGSRTTAERLGREFRWLECIDDGSGS